MKCVYDVESRSTNFPLSLEVPVFAFQQLSRLQHFLPHHFPAFSQFGLAGHARAPAIFFFMTFPPFPS